MKSSTGAGVYAQGIRVGPTNQKVAIRCGLRWIRLGTEPGPTWVSAGRTVSVRCRATTEITIQPER